MNSRAIPPVLTAAPVGCGGESAEPGAVLPFPSPPMGGSVGPTMQESVHQWRTEPRHLPEDAPNILIVMSDDAGFGQPSTFGGEIQTPTLSRLAEEGISYNAFPISTSTWTSVVLPPSRPSSGPRISRSWAGRNTWWAPH